MTVVVRGWLDGLRPVPGSDVYCARLDRLAELRALRCRLDAEEVELLAVLS